MIKNSENNLVICVIKNKEIIGCVSKIVFNNMKDGNNTHTFVDPNPNKAVRFKYCHSCMVLLTHLCTNQNAQNNNGVEFFIDYYENVYKKYRQALKEKKK